MATKTLTNLIAHFLRSNARRDLQYIVLLPLVSAVVLHQLSSSLFPLTAVVIAVEEVIAAFVLGTWLISVAREQARYKRALATRRDGGLDINLTEMPPKLDCPDDKPHARTFETAFVRSVVAGFTFPLFPNLFGDMVEPPGFIASATIFSAAFLANMMHGHAGRIRSWLLRVVASLRATHQAIVTAFNRLEDGPKKEKCFALYRYYLRACIFSAKKQVVRLHYPEGTPQDGADKLPARTSTCLGDLFENLVAAAQEAGIYGVVAGNNGRFYPMNDAISNIKQGIDKRVNRGALLADTIMFGVSYCVLALLCLAADGPVWLSAICLSAFFFSSHIIVDLVDVIAKHFGDKDGGPGVEGEAPYAMLRDLELEMDSMRLASCYNHLLLLPTSEVEPTSAES